MEKIENQRMQNMLSFLAQFSGGMPGEDFFQTLARFLAENLDMDYVCIDRLEGDQKSARTLAVYFEGHFEDNISYTLQDTPCGKAVGQIVCCFPKHVRHLFPRDSVLQEMQAESYIGVTLWDHAGEPIGLIAVIGRRPLADSRMAEEVLKLAGVRAAGELERQQAEEALRRKTSELENFFEINLDLLCIADTDGYFRKLNPEWEHTLGYPLPELEGKRFLDLVHPADLPATLEAVAQLAAQQKVINFVNRYRCKDGSYRWIEWRSVPAQELIYAAARDITARKETEQALQAALEREKILQRDIYHRTKNHLAQVSGLLNLQSEDLRDPWDIEIFNEVQNRIYSMSTLNEFLYRSDDLLQVNFEEYVNRLTAHLSEAYRPQEVEFIVEIEAQPPIALHASLASPCGLILTELISNAIKHAFEPGQIGRVTIGMRRAAGGYELSVSNTGKTFPKDADWRQSQSMGTQLLLLLVEQIKGEIKLEQNGATRFIITFPEKSGL